MITLERAIKKRSKEPIKNTGKKVKSEKSNIAVALLKKGKLDGIKIIIYLHQCYFRLLCVGKRFCLKYSLFLAGYIFFHNSNNMSHTYYHKIQTKLNLF